MKFSRLILSVFLIFAFLTGGGSALFAQGNTGDQSGGGLDIYMQYKNKKSYNVHHKGYVPTNTNYYNESNNRSQSWRNY